MALHAKKLVNMRKMMAKYGMMSPTMLRKAMMAKAMREKRISKRKR